MFSNRRSQRGGRRAKSENDPHLNSTGLPKNLPQKKRQKSQPSSKPSKKTVKETDVPKPSETFKDPKTARNMLQCIHNEGPTGSRVGT